MVYAKVVLVLSLAFIAPSFAKASSTEAGATAVCTKVAKLSPAKLGVMARDNGLTAKTLKEECYLWSHRDQFTHSTQGALASCRYFRSIGATQLAAFAKSVHTTTSAIREACADAALPKRPAASSDDDGESGHFNPFQCLNDASCGIFESCVSTGLGSQCVSNTNCTVPGKSCSIQGDCCSGNCNAGTCE